MTSYDAAVNGVRYNPTERVVHGVEIGCGYLEVCREVADEYPEYVARLLDAARSLKRCAVSAWTTELGPERVLRVCIAMPTHYPRIDHFEPFHPEPYFATTMGIELPSHQHDAESQAPALDSRVLLPPSMLAE